MYPPFLTLLTRPTRACATASHFYAPKHTSQNLESYKTWVGKLRCGSSPQLPEVLEEGARVEEAAQLQRHPPPLGMNPERGGRAGERGKCDAVCVARHWTIASPFMVGADHGDACLLATASCLCQRHVDDRNWPQSHQQRRSLHRTTAHSTLPEMYDR